MATSSKRTTTKKTEATPTKEPVVMDILNDEERVEAPAKEAPKRAKVEKKASFADVDPNQTVLVINGFPGRLVYKSKRTGERFVWSEMGDEQEMELKELRNAKNSAKGFFTKNWFLFGEDDQWVIDYLALGAYYKNSIGIDEIDDLLKSNYKIIESRLAHVTKGQKATLANRARQLIANREIDSNRSIATLEKMLGVGLVER